VAAGEDRQFDPKSWSRHAQDLPDYSEDLVYENGTFVRMWSVWN
jgi:hypothetical protein